jgi:hypothetical protein
MKMNSGWNLRLASMVLLVAALCFGFVAVHSMDWQVRLMNVIALAIDVCGATVLFLKSKTHGATST